MPSWCVVIKCSNRSGRDKKSFYRLPVVRSNGTTERQLLQRERRFKWLCAIRRSELINSMRKNIRVCEDHFISGKPADLYDVTNPDWVPCINLGYVNDKISQNIKRYLRAQKRLLSDGRPASNYDIENPDWVPSINMGYPDKQKSTHTSPHIEYLRSSVINQNESNENIDESSSNTDIHENFTDQDSNTSEVTENDSTTLQTASAENYVQKDINLPEDISTEEILPLFVACNEGENNSKNTAIDKHFLSEFISNDEVHENMSSKLVQTDLTMTDLDSISDAYKDSVIEVKKLRAKLKALTEDILHINEMYC